MLSIPTFIIDNSFRLSRKQIRGEAADKARRERLKSWHSSIVKELRYIDLITMVLKTELAIINDDLPSIDPRVVYARDHWNIIESQLQRQASYIYHELYRGTQDRIRVVDTNNASINHRFGLITGYNKSIKKFTVRLDTMLVSPATRFTGEELSICGSCLQIVPVFSCSGQTKLSRSTKPTKLSKSSTNSIAVRALPKKITAIILSHDTAGSVFNTSIEVRRCILDILDQSFGDDAAIQLTMQFVRPFILATKCESKLRQMVLRSQSSVQNNLKRDSPWHSEFDYDPHNVVDQILHRQKRQDTRMTSTAERTQHTISTTNGYTGTELNPQPVTHECASSIKCGECCHQDTNVPALDAHASLADHFTPKANFDMNLIAKPYEVLFQFPFITSNSGLSTAAFELNEMNIVPNLQSVQTDDEIFGVLERIPVCIYNKDLYSLLPYERISDSITDMWSQW